MKNLNAFKFILLIFGVTIFKLQARDMIIIESVEIDKEKNSWFNPERNGWLAGDVGHSILLNDDKILWIFGDSFYGEFREGKLKRDGLHINNCIAIQDRKISNDLVFYKGSDEATRAFFPHPRKNFPGTFLWPTNGIYTDGSLYIFCQAMDIDNTSFWTMVGTIVIEIPNPNDNPNRWGKKYYDFNTEPWVGDTFQRQYHSAVFLSKSHIYFKGFTLHNGSKKSILSRMIKNDFKSFKDSKYLEHLVTSGDSTKWSNVAENFKFLYSPGNTESNIQYSEKLEKYISTTYSALDQDILIVYADNLIGPWSKPKLLYKNPVRVCPNSTCIETYAVRLHPELAKSKDELIISYIISYQGEFDEISIDQYRPRFIKVNLGDNHH